MEKKVDKSRVESLIGVIKDIEAELEDAWAIHIEQTRLIKQTMSILRNDYLTKGQYENFCEDLDELNVSPIMLKHDILSKHFPYLGTLRFNNVDMSNTLWRNRNRLQRD